MNVAVVDEERKSETPWAILEWRCDNCNRLLAKTCDLEKIKGDLVIRCGRCGKDHPLSEFQARLANV